jgi:serralysin
MPKSQAAEALPLMTSLSVGTDGNDVFTVDPTALEGGELDGGLGDDTLQLSSGGSFDLTLPSVFTGIETLLGSDQHDTIILDQDRFGGISAFDGGANPESHWDEIVLRGAVFDFTGKTLIGIDRLSLEIDNAVLVAPDLKTAMLASGLVSQNDRLEVAGVALSAEQIRMLHRQGIDTIIDAVGSHVNAAPVISHLNGERVRASVGQTVFIDAGRDTTVFDDDSSYSLLTITALRNLDAPGYLNIDATGLVTFDDGYRAGSIVRVGGIEVGMVWEAGDASISIAFNNVNATAERVQEIVRAITYTTADTPPQASTQQAVTVTLTDEGGRRSSSTVLVEQNVVLDPPEVLLSHARIPELSVAGTLVGLLTANVLGAGDAFTFTLLNDAGHRFALQGDRLIVATGASLDYEQQASHTVVVRATGGDGQIIDQSFVIRLEDVANEVVVGTPTVDGSGAVRGTDGNDKLIGTRGQDVLNGGLGNDLIFGRLGSDVLIGGKGRDTFVFDTKPNARTNLDRVKDFSVKDDSIYLDNAIFKALGKKGMLAKPAKLQAKMFWKGAKAHDADDRVIYNPKTGALYYDADGTGSKSAVKIAALSKNLKIMSYKDFFVV